MSHYSQQERQNGPVKILGQNVSEIVAWIWRAFVLAGICAMLYLRSIFATSDELSKRVDPVAVAVMDVTPRVRSIEEWRVEQRAHQAASDRNISQIQQDLSSIKALQSEAAKNTERILRRLDYDPRNPFSQQNP